MEIIPAIIGSSLDQLKMQLIALDGEKIVHVDLMDGQFVPESSPEGLLDVLGDLHQYDVHGMVKHPVEYLPVVVNLNLRFFFVHAELPHHVLEEVFTRTKNLPVHMGLACNPKTVSDSVAEWEHHLKAVLLMGVDPGAAGRQFDERVIEKIHYLKEHFSSLAVVVDGGINEQTIADVSDADAAVVHSAIFSHTEQSPLRYLETLRHLVP